MEEHLRKIVEEVENLQQENKSLKRRNNEP